MKQHKIKIRPLSEGIGLGSLKSPMGRVIGGSAALTSDDGLVASPKIDSVVMRQAHAAYAPKSVGAELRSRPSVRWAVAFRRFVADAGADLFVGVISALVFVWSGILAWEAGSVGRVSPFDAFMTIQDFLTHMTVPMWILVLLFTAALSRAFRVIFLRV
jgi:hypothetical protein